ncbi:anthranilate synthase family protein [Amycolatopsis cihanbeyliensis]|uniref:anthranilate synthase n=1 Tax=Amycolatopsis cihanbeyliensis TaxID=1128664 RepID=A0A542DS07_AMYCI|nr:anthranilate synthase family protein [Amycolatopsis cihanbeyliensis]TQJ05911.1 phenazine biosynthesis protein phzE [Amycolatopsis cihanbeyliensis]
MAADLLGRILAPQPPAFALLHRPEITGADTLDILVGTMSTPETLAEIPLPEACAPTGGARHETLTIVPYRQIAERGFASTDDGSPLIAITVTDQSTASATEVLDRLPDTPIRVKGGHFDVDDDAYAEIVRKIIADEIGRGEGANFVIKRSFVADISDYTPYHALTLFRRLLQRESGAYWTFLVHTGAHTFVGASPERHVSLHHGTAVMNPVSGTYRYPPSGPVLHEVLDFLADHKETAELYMVVDEELKMMARICEHGGRVEGPYLKEMAYLAHTEYFIDGHSTRDPREILHETMFAPTVTGSPLESACRVINRYEPQGRGYYSGIVALMGRDAHGGRTMDSSILIRTAHLDDRGRIKIGVGATLVRDSDPASEVAETHAKAAGLLAALGTDRPPSLSEHPGVLAALAERNTTISKFWRTREDARSTPEPELAGLRVLVIDAEDTFTSMLYHQLRSAGLVVTVRRFDEPYSFSGHDLVVLGPGPGDPRETVHPKIDHLRSAVRTLLAQRRPFLAVCLSHQVLCAELGFALVRREVPNQGVQRRIDLFGAPERVGFYNSFVVYSGEDKVTCDGVGTVEVSRDAEANEVHALRGPYFASLQFHAESLLTQDGMRIVGELMKDVLGYQDLEAAENSTPGREVSALEPTTGWELLRKVPAQR